MLAACEQNGTVLSVDHTRRFTPLWRYAKEQLLDKGEIGEVQWLVARLQGNRAMMFRNGTHVIDAMLWFAGGTPKWVMADFEDGFEDFDKYGRRGMDGGKDPSLEPAVNGYVSFDTGVKAIFMGGSKSTPAPKMGVEVVGTTGRLIMDDIGDGKNKAGDWTGTYRNSGVIWRGDVSEEFHATQEYIDIVKPNPRQTKQQGDSGQLPGISAGVRDLVNVLADGAEIVSPPGAAQVRIARSSGVYSGGEVEAE